MNHYRDLIIKGINVQTKSLHTLFLELAPCTSVNCTACKIKTFTGYRSEVGTIVYELTHTIIHTADYYYGRRRIKNPGKRIPERAALNGANYAHLVESLTK